VGTGIFTLTIALGVIDAVAPESSMLLLSTDLSLLGVGWSMFLIGGSALLTASVPARAKVTLQGASDSAIHLGGAVVAALAGSVLGAGGILWINLMATFVLLISAGFAIRAVPHLYWPERTRARAAMTKEQETTTADRSGDGERAIRDTGMSGDEQR